MKIVIAPNSLKGTLSASAVAEAIGAAVLQAAGDVRIDLCPMADGGEGTVEAIVAATAGQIVTTDVFGPLGEQRRAKFGLVGSGGGAGLPGEVGLSGAVGLSSGQGNANPPDGRQVAVIEMAAAAGLSLVRPDMLDPLRTTTFGVGQLISAALEAGAAEIIVGLGDSATIDGGCGCAQALGVTFIDAKGRGCVCGLAGGGLADVRGIDITGRDDRLDAVAIRAACDVTNPLTGPSGAARTYGPQKGATAEVVDRIEAGLVHLAGVIRDELGIDVTDIEGAGAAGGLAAGLVAFTGATLHSGVSVVAEAVGLAGRLTGADLCITAEGTLDAQSASGKTTIGVAEMARLAGVPVVCIPGQLADDAPTELFADVRPLVADQVTRNHAMAKPAALLAQRTAEAMADFMRG